MFLHLVLLHFDFFQFAFSSFPDWIFIARLHIHTLIRQLVVQFSTKPTVAKLRLFPPSSFDFSAPSSKIF